MFCKVLSFGLQGIEPYLVSVEVDSRKGLPGFDIVGLPGAAVKESRDRVRSAIQNLGYPLPGTKVVANLAPADTRKEGSVYDLAILLGLIHAAGYETLELEGTAFIGEIGLSGELRGVAGALPMTLDAAALGLRRVVVPQRNAGEAAMAEGVEVLCAEHAAQVLAWLKGEGSLKRAAANPASEPTEADSLDFRDVKGQEEARYAMEVAAAGGHNLLLIGPPGAGKSMLAGRLPSILPPMSREEAIETTKIHSVAGCLQDGGLVTRRPFQAPHHSVSAASLTGGGSDPKPGEASLAHNGVLFLDELPEFQKNSLEALRQPLEDGRVSISRVRGRADFPSRVMLVAAMNPCPCGYYGHPVRPCTCSPTAIQRYLSRVSGPLLDRIDLHVEALPVDYGQLSSSQAQEDSVAIRERVCAARERQRQRYRGTGCASNADLPPAMLQSACRMESAAERMLAAAFDRLALSARGYSRILKVARTIADLDGAEIIGTAHITRAIQFRSLDRKYWGGSAGQRGMA